MFGWIIAAALAAQAPPATAPAALPDPPATVLAIDAVPPDPRRIEALPPDLRARVHAEVIAPSHSQLERLQRLVDFLFGPQRAGLAYQPDATYTVEQAWRTRRGNCVAFTLLFLALADEAGLDAWPQESEDSLAWQLRDNTLYRTNHVSAVARVGRRTWRVDATPQPVIERDPPGRIDRERLRSHYYNNLAVALMEQGRLEDAGRYMDAAIALDPRYASTWSNAGVVALRGGDRESARRDYAHALQLEPDNAGALFNMVGLLEHDGSARDLATYRNRLERVQRQDPFHHFMLAIDDERAGDLAGAIEHFRSAARLMPREYRFHLALARAYREAGDARRADRSLARARALAGREVAEPPAPGGIPGTAAVQPPG
ncbi:MAG TPA: tetratricopeptide repeat protein [Luteimonas sp.]|nr:tetratricopeptide repeat protein [Luteimonas sp.]